MFPSTSTPQNRYITPFEHPTTPFPFPSNDYFPFYTSPPPRTTSITPSSVPLSPPVPSRKAPTPPRRIPRALRNHRRSNHMQMIEPEQVGLWTLIEDPQGEAAASSDSSEWIWGACQLNNVDEGVKGMVADVDASQWHATGEGVGLGISGVRDVGRPAEVFDGLFYVPPGDEGVGLRTYLRNRDEVDSPTSSESSFGTLDSPPSPAITITSPVVQPRATIRRTTLIPPPPLNLAQGDMSPAERAGVPQLLQSPFVPVTPGRKRPTPLAESPAREGKLLSPRGSDGRRPSFRTNVFETPRIRPALAVISSPTSGSSTSAQSIASTSSSISSSEGLPITPRTADIERLPRAVPMQRHQQPSFNGGKNLSAAFERFLRVADGMPDEDEDDEESLYFRGQGFPLPPLRLGELPATPERRERRDVPPTPRKANAAPAPSKGYDEDAGSVPRSCRALQDVMGFASPTTTENMVYGRTSLPNDNSQGTPSSPLFFEFIIDVGRRASASESGEKKMVLCAVGAVRQDKKDGMRRNRGLPARSGLPQEWLYSVRT